MALKDTSPLDPNDRDTALIPLSSSKTRKAKARKKLIAGFAESLFRQNPMKSVWEKTTLFENYTSPLAFESNTWANTRSLDAQQSFNDGYSHFVFHMNTASSNASAENDIEFLHINPIIVNASETAPLGIYHRKSNRRLRVSKFARITNTSFRIRNEDYTVSGPNFISRFATLYLTKIVGYKQIIRPSSL